jgi:hypothetical protein
MIQGGQYLGFTLEAGKAVGVLGEAGWSAPRRFSTWKGDAGRAPAPGEMPNLKIRPHDRRAAPPTFTEQHMVANGASELLAEVFGESGTHARSAFGAAQVPFGSCVEIDLIAEVHDQ